MPTARQMILDPLTRDDVIVADRRQEAHLAERLEQMGHGLSELLIRTGAARRPPNVAESLK